MENGAVDADREEAFLELLDAEDGDAVQLEQEGVAEIDEVRGHEALDALD